MLLNIAELQASYLPGEQLACETNNEIRDITSSEYSNIYSGEI
jgi:hypothetical protein